MGLTVAPRSGLVGTISRKKFLNRCDANAIWQDHLPGPVGMLETGVEQHLARRSSSEKIINALPCSSRDYIRSPADNLFRQATHAYLLAVWPPNQLKGAARLARSSARGHRYHY
jgi:hypothetical protein